MTFRTGDNVYTIVRISLAGPASELLNDEKVRNTFLRE